MKKYFARIYTAGDNGPDQHILEFETSSMAKARSYAKAIAKERDGRLVSVLEVRPTEKQG